VISYRLEECPLRELETETQGAFMPKPFKPTREECPLRELETETSCVHTRSRQKAHEEECPLRELETETDPNHRPIISPPSGGMPAQGIRD